MTNRIYRAFTLCLVVGLALAAIGPLMMVQAEGGTKTIQFQMKGYDYESDEYADLSLYFDPEYDEIDPALLVTYTFSVTVPETWYAAIKGDAEWEQVAAELDQVLPVVIQEEEEEGEEAAWIEEEETEVLDSWIGAGVDLDEQYVMAAGLFIVETDVDVLKAGGMPIMAGLDTIEVLSEWDYYASYGCDDVRAGLEQQKTEFEEFMAMGEEFAEGLEGLDEEMLEGLDEEAAADLLESLEDLDEATEDLEEAQEDAAGAMEDMFSEVEFIAVEVGDGLCAARADMVIASGSMDEEGMSSEGAFLEGVAPPEEIRLIQVYIPITAQAASVWAIFLPESQYEMFQPALETFIQSMTVEKQ